MLSLSPLVLAAVFPYGLAISRSDMNWGSAAEWVGAIGTFAAVATALGIAIGDARRRESERKEVQAAQARLIIVDAHEDVAGGVIYVSVTNHSAFAVFAVAVEAVHVTPDPLRVRFHGAREWVRLDPSESRRVSCSLFELDGATMASVGASNILSADVSFVDSAGLRWRRWGNTPPRGGAPIRRRQPPSPVEEVAGPEDD
jgi:hypothetical protein